MIFSKLNKNGTVSLAELMNKERLEKLECLLGTDNNGLLNPITIDIEHDRTDTFIVNSAFDFVNKLNEVAEILGVNPKEFVTHRIDSESDHESVTHGVDLNNKSIAGGLIQIKGINYKILSYNRDDDIYEIESLEDGQIRIVGSTVITLNRERNWREILGLYDWME